MGSGRQPHKAVPKQYEQGKLEERAHTYTASSKTTNTHQRCLGNRARAGLFTTLVTSAFHPFLFIISTLKVG